MGSKNMSEEQIKQEKIHKIELAVEEETYKELNKIKENSGDENIAALLSKSISVYKFFLENKDSLYLKNGPKWFKINLTF